MEPPGKAPRGSYPWLRLGGRAEDEGKARHRSRGRRAWEATVCSRSNGFLYTAEEKPALYWGVLGMKVKTWAAVPLPQGFTVFTQFKSQRKVWFLKIVKILPPLTWSAITICKCACGTASGQMIGFIRCTGVILRAVSFSSGRYWRNLSKCSKHKAFFLSQGNYQS